MSKNLSESAGHSSTLKDRPAWLVWIWVFVCLAQVGQGALYWTWSAPDRNRQLLAAASWVDGHGLSEPFLDAVSGEIRYERLVSWAPGYSVLAGLGYLLVGDWMIVSQLISGLAVLLVFLGLWLMFRPLRQWLTWQHEVFLLLFWAISFAPFHHFTDTDLLSLGAALIASSWMLERTSRGYFLATIFLCLAAWFRIAYVPMILIPAMMSWWDDYSWVPSRKTIIQAGVGGILLAGYWLLLKPSHPVSGGVGDLMTSGRWFPEHWLSWDAFPVKSWLYVSAEGIGNKGGEEAGLVSSGILFLLSSSIFVIISNDVRGSFSSHGTGKQSFSRLLTLVTLSTCLFLGWLSLRTPEEIHDGIRTWTYVQETRYYAWSLILLPISLVTWKGWQRSSLVRLAMVSFIMLAGWGHGIYRHSSAIFRDNHAATRWSLPEREFSAFFDQVKKNTERGPVWIVPGTTIRSRDLTTIGCLAGGILVDPDAPTPEKGIVVDLRKKE